MKALVPFTLFMAAAALVFAAPPETAGLFAVLAFAWLALSCAVLWSEIK